MLKVSPKRFDYQLYFQDEGVAEAELEKDVGYSIACIVRGVSDKIPGVNTEEVRKRGGLLVGCPRKNAFFFSQFLIDIIPAPHELKISSILSKEDFEYYKQAFTSSGFSKFFRQIAICQNESDNFCSRNWTTLVSQH